MPCKKCEGEEGTDVRHQCRVCELLDGDLSVKRVKYCKVCKAYICEKCRSDMWRRAMAFSQDTAEAIGNMIKKITNA